MGTVHARLDTTRLCDQQEVGATRGLAVSVEVVRGEDWISELMTLERLTFTSSSRTGLEGAYTHNIPILVEEPQQVRLVVASSPQHSALTTNALRTPGHILLILLLLLEHLRHRFPQLTSKPEPRPTTYTAELFSPLHTPHLPLSRVPPSSTLGWPPISHSISRSQLAIYTRI